ncbi:DUF2155 domain-containing protein [Roseovarius sp. Pro17]|uniref:DUF2155 domain-containing protein n=1 Tax=Roseovarius sp. Pro17 TaxID=3108175 RepID=UPI002D78F517|nr:DUF2155 domain-containing protein [Roseovarius sp. Pro17]
MRLLSLTIAMFLPLAASAQENAAVGTGAVLRGLEKISGDVIDITLGPGEQADFGPLTVQMAECRYPQGDPAADAFAFLSIRDEGQDEPIFSGWMIASSPALNALDHPRYDVWVLRCKTE